MKIEVKPGLSIGEGQPVFVICEVGSNWSTLEDCMTSITKAKQCGADAVKFQAFNKKALYGFHYEHQMVYFEYIHSADPSELPGTLPLEWLPKLKEKADAVGIEFMCSAFSPELAEAVNPFVSIHKVASSEMCHVRLLEKLKGFGKPVILSTGAQHVEDIGRAIDTLGDTPTVLLYCAAAYPANDLDLATMDALRDAFESLVGYSDHTTDVRMYPMIARGYGACVIEKHVNLVDATGPDAPHSINADQFKTCVQYAKGPAPAPKIGPTPAEKPMILRHKRRLIATRDVAEGDALREGENFGIYRSLKDDTHAFSPFMVNEVEGRIAKREIKAGDGVGPGDC